MARETIATHTCDECAFEEQRPFEGDFGMMQGWSRVYIAFTRQGDEEGLSVTYDICPYCSKAPCDTVVKLLNHTPNGRFMKD